MPLPSSINTREANKFVEDAAGNVAVRVVATDGTGSDLAVAEDSIHTTGDAGIAAMAVRNDAGTGLAADGDYINLTTNSVGALYVTGGGGGVEYVEDAAAAADPTGSAQILVRLDTPATLTDTDGDNVARRGTDYGAAYSQIVTSAGAFVDSFGGGTQYTEAAVDATITGTALMMEDAGDTLRAATGDVTNGLDVDVTRVIPGTGATNLGKAEDAAHVSADTGIAMLGVRSADILPNTPDTNDDYAIPNIDSKGRMRVSPGGQHAYDTFAVTTGWTVFNDDAANIATNLDHVTGVGSLTFDKVNGTANTVFALIQKTITSVNLNGVATGSLFMQTVMKIPNLTNVVNVVMRYGTDNTNYNEWKIDPSDITINQWTIFRAALGSSQGSTGNGWDLTAITYIAVGLEFSSESDTLSGILVDSLTSTGGQVNSSDTSTEVTAGATNVNLQKVGGSTTDKGAGNASTGSQRVVIATDDVNLASINTDAGTIAGAVAAGQMQVDIVADGAGLALAANQLADGHNVTVDNASIAVTGTFFQATQPVSAATLPLPSGASTSAAQLPDGHAVTIDNIVSNEVFIRGSQTAGSPVDGEVVTIQGIASGTVVPVSGTVTATPTGTQNVDITAQTLANLQIQSNSANIATETTVATLATEATLGTIDTDTGNIDTNTTNIPNVIGTDGGVGPTSVLSVGGTESGGNIQEVLVSSTGAVQVDVLSGGGGGEQTLGTDLFAEASDTGIYAAVVRSDALASLVDTTNEATAMQVNNIGALYVEAVQTTAGSLNMTEASAATIATNTTDLNNAIGTDGAVGPTRAMSIAGTNAGNLQEIAVDATGNLQVDIVADAAGLALAANQLADGHDVTIDNLVSDEVFIRGSQSAGSPVDGEVVTIQGIASGTVVPVSGTVTATPSGTQNVDITAQTLANLQVQSNSVNIATETTAAAILVDTAIMSEWDNAASDGASVTGALAHDAPDAGIEPVKVGLNTVNMGTDPTEVSAADDLTDAYATRAGIMFVQPGHPNLLTKSWNITDADGAQTDLNLLAAVVAATDVCVVTGVSVNTDAATTAGTQVRIGFGATNTPALDAAGVLISAAGIPPGGGQVLGFNGGMVGRGASGEELRMTSQDAVGGSVDVVVSYYIISNS